MNIWDIINGITVSYIIVLAISLIGKSKLKNKAHNFLAIFLLAQSSCILNSFLYRFFSVTHIQTPYLFNIADTLLYLWGPALFLYIKSYTRPEFKLSYKSLLHLIPFAIHGTILTFTFHRFNSDSKTTMLAQGIFSHEQILLFYAAFHLHMLVYLTFACISVRKFRQKVKRENSTSYKSYQNWIVFVLLGFVSVWLLDVSFHTIRLLSNHSPFFLLNIIYPLIFIIVFIIMVKGLNNPMIFQYHKSDLKRKYIGSNLKVDEKKIIYDNILRSMNENKLYRVPSINITSLAKELTVLPKHLSQVINEYFNMNFFDFINDYRIKEAKHQLSQSTETRKTILEILYDTGFNSKSSFNKAFKKSTGVSPTEYRKMHSAKIA